MTSLTNTETAEYPADVMEAAEEAYEACLDRVAGSKEPMPVGGWRAVYIAAIAKAILAERQRGQNQAVALHEKAVAIAARIDLRQTCFACPEQYDATLDGQPVGYLRLRHGTFRVDYPECGGTTVLTGHPNGDGIFDDEERDEWLEKAKMALATAVLNWADPSRLMGEQRSEG